MNDILRQILRHKADEVAAGKSRLPLAELAARSADLPAARGFTRALAAASREGPAVIAEIKRASPSAGTIREDFDPHWLAQRYADAGAACVSVLTDSRFFRGEPEHLAMARSACELPLLRKDFLIDPWQVGESRAMGADCVLLIVAALGTDQLQDLHGLAQEAGLDALVEVHDETELERALAAGASLVGVNNRNLRTFVTDITVSERLAGAIPASALMVSESGIQRREDVERLGAAGVRCFLVGEGLLRAADPGAALKALFFP